MIIIKNMIKILNNENNQNITIPIVPGLLYSMDWRFRGLFFSNMGSSDIYYFIIFIIITLMESGIIF